MRSREVDLKLRGTDCPPQLKAVLMEIAEDQMSERQQIMQLADMLDKVMTNMTTMMMVAGNMKEMVDSLGGAKSAKDMMKRMEPPDESD